MKITREWAMPNKRTFQINPIKNLIRAYKREGIWADPFPYPFKQEALQYLSTFEECSVDGVLFDPPYSPRQLKECYESRGESLHDTKSSVWATWKDAVSRIVKSNGTVISFGWSSMGMSKSRGFEIIEILLVPHGGNHNDTIVVVEKKVNKSLVECV